MAAALPQGSIPDAASSLAVSETQRIVLYFSELVVVMSGSEADNFESETAKRWPTYLSG